MIAAVVAAARMLVVAVVLVVVLRRVFYYCCDCSGNDSSCGSREECGVAVLAKTYCEYKQ